jgi:tripartite-type tricarboxylate transporter receptor subunit TctC
MTEARLARRRALALALAAPMVALARPVLAQGPWPARPITLMIGFPPGGQADFASRLMQNALAAAFGQPIIIENRPGAGGNIATEQVLRARPDGYTLLAGNIGTFTINPHTMPGMGFDPMELVPIGLMLQSGLLLAVHPSLPVRSFAEWRAWVMRGQPRGVDYASTSAGGLVHVATEMLRMRLGGPVMHHIPYRGSGPALQDLIAGVFPTMFDAPSLLFPFVQVGQARGIMLTTARRLPAMPDIPTAEESGLPDFVVSSWIGLFGPRGTPPEIVARANAVLNEVCGNPEIRARIDARGDEAGGGTTEAFTAMIRRDHARWGEVVRANGIRAE